MPHAEEEPIKAKLRSFESEASNIVQIKHFKTRKSGSQRFIDFHLGLSPEITIMEGQRIAEEIRGELYIPTSRAISISRHTAIWNEPQQKGPVS